MAAELQSSSSNRNSNNNNNNIHHEICNRIEQILNDVQADVIIQIISGCSNLKQTKHKTCQKQREWKNYFIPIMQS